MFVFIPGSIPPVRFGPGGTDPAEISIPAVTYISLKKCEGIDCSKKIKKDIKKFYNVQTLIFQNN